MTHSVAVSVRSEGDTTSVCLTGSLDLSTTGSVERQLFSVVDDPAATRLCLDLSDVDFIDSTGLAMLVRVARSAMRQGVDFGVVAVSDRVEKEFERMRLSTLLIQRQERASAPRDEEPQPPA